MDLRRCLGSHLHARIEGILAAEHGVLLRLTSRWCLLLHLIEVLLLHCHLLVLIRSTIILIPVELLRSLPHAHHREHHAGVVGHLTTVHLGVFLLPILLIIPLFVLLLGSKVFVHLSEQVLLNNKADLVVSVRRELFKFIGITALSKHLTVFEDSEIGCHGSLAVLLNKFVKLNHSLRLTKLGVLTFVDNCSMV